MLKLTHSLLSKKEILSNRVKLKKHPGVYFLIKGKEIVYIGSSLYLEQRVAQHHRHMRNKSGKRRGQIEFDSYMLLLYDESKMKQIERAYIDSFKPHFNDTPIPEPN